MPQAKDRARSGREIPIRRHPRSRRPPARADDAPAAEEEHRRPGPPPRLPRADKPAIGALAAPANPQFS
jgi:hypothetical protein